jgi:hypothetical protein
MRYVLNILIAVDQVANAILGGYPDETISLRAALARDNGERWGCLLCRLLDAIVADHCSNSIIHERGERRV